METALLDREPERGRIDGVLAAARQGRSAALVLQGEPGTGKTTLLDYAVESGGDFDVVRLLGIESETELGFAALHQLLLPFLDGLGSLPAPQRDALAGALGLRRTDPPDRFLLGLAALTMLSGAAAKRPLLCVVDDAQWLDRESASILGFIARRLSADAIAMLFAVRDPSDRDAELDGIPWVQIGDLPPAEAGQLLASAAAAGRVDHRVCEHIITQIGGNPLGLIELGRELSQEQLAGEISLPELLPIGGSLQARYLRQIGHMPLETQVFLLAAAADPTGDPALLQRAGEFLGFGIRAASPAEAQGLVRFTPLVKFRHPLIRSAVYHGATLAERVRVHEALARATDPVAAADLRAWHRAEAAIGPDESVAGELERAADRARARGGWAASARFLTRAAALTPDADQRFRRVLAAARAETTAGACVRAQALLDSVAGQLDDPAKHAAALRVQGTIRYALDQSAEAAAVLLDAGRRLAPLDTGLARATLLEALAAARISGRLARAGAGGADIAQTVRSWPAPPAGVTIGELVLEADTALNLDGPDAAVPVVKRAVAAMLAAPDGSAELLPVTGVACPAASTLGDDHALHSLAGRLEVQAREQGAVLPLSTVLIFSGWAELFAGHLGQAYARYTERGAIEAARGGSCEVGRALVLAWRGMADEARVEATAAARVAVEQGEGWKLALMEYARAVLALGMGRYDEALAAVPGRFEDHVLLGTYALPDLIEAAVRCGERDAAEQVLARVASRAAASPTPLMLGLLARSRALLSGGTDAEASYREAISHLEHARGRVHLARAELLYGEWLRREKRPRDAREHLQAAYDVFRDVGADGFAERARGELAAAGQTARPPASSPGGSLTPQERQVATLAAASFTNLEIASRLFISPKTVDYHLGKVFRKLGVGSRRQLARVPLE